MNFFHVLYQIIFDGFVLVDDVQVGLDRRIRRWVQIALGVLLAGLVLPRFGNEWVNTALGYSFPFVAFMLIVRRVPQSILLALGYASERVAALERLIVGWLGAWAMFGLVPLLVPIQYAPSVVPVAVVALVAITLISVELGGGERTLKILYAVGVAVLLGCLVWPFWARHAAETFDTPAVAPARLPRHTIPIALCRPGITIAPPAAEEDFEIILPADCNRACIARPADAPRFSAKPRGIIRTWVRFGRREEAVVGRVRRYAAVPDVICFATSGARQIVAISYIRGYDEIP